MKQILSLIAFSSALIIACTGTTSCSNKANAPESRHLHRQRQRKTPLIRPDSLKIYSATKIR